jgi:hypothetical protein
VSPWKYSWKGSRLCQSRWVWKRPGVAEEMNAQAFSLTADGDAEWVTQDVPSLLGRPARSFGQFAADCAAAFS